MKHMTKKLKFRENQSSQAELHLQHITTFPSVGLATILTLTIAPHICIMTMVIAE